MAISASNTGGAWDNAKKYIEAGLMKDGDVVVKKHTEIPGTNLLDSLRFAG